MIEKSGEHCRLTEAVGGWPRLTWGLDTPASEAMLYSLFAWASYLCVKAQGSMFSKTRLFPVLCFTASKHAHRVFNPSSLYMKHSECRFRVVNAFNATSIMVSYLAKLIQVEKIHHEWGSNTNFENRKLFWAFVAFSISSAVLICTFLILLLIYVDFIMSKNIRAF